MPYLSRPLSERIWEKVQRGGPDECWPWTGGNTGTTRSVTYGRIKSGPDRRTLAVHRAVLELELGRPLLPGMMALHTCDFGLCCNPAHLYEGTHEQNMRDRGERGRTRGARCGERHHFAKLTDAQHAEVRRRRLAHEPLKALASEFGISVSRVSQIAKEKP